MIKSVSRTRFVCPPTSKGIFNFLSNSSSCLSDEIFLISLIKTLKPKDFANWAGFDARIVMEKGYAGQRVNKGVLGGLEGDFVLITEAKAGAVKLPLAEIHSARLVLTDALIAATRPLDTSGAEELLEDNTTHDEEEKADD